MKIWTTDVTKKGLKERWHPVVVAHESDNIGELDSMFSLMNIWCENNCIGNWTIAWYQDDFTYWFTSMDDFVMFHMVWR